MKLSKYSLSLLAFCLFFNVGVAEAKVCMITDPNCNDPLDFTMPDCDDEVVKGEFPYKDDAACEADTINYGRYYTPDYSDEYAYSYNTADKKCSKACRPKTCQELSGEFQYKNDAGCEAESGYQMLDTSPASAYPYNDKVSDGPCYKSCQCKEAYKETSVTCGANSEPHGGPCVLNGTEYFEKCVPNCNNTEVTREKGYKFNAGNCTDLDASLTLEGQYTGTTVNNQCWTTCIGPELPSCTAPMEPEYKKVTLFDGTDRDTSVTCNCPSGWVDERDICPDGETTEFSGDTCTQNGITYREKRGCTKTCVAQGYKWHKLPAGNDTLPGSEYCNACIDGEPCIESGVPYYKSCGANCKGTVVTKTDTEGSSYLDCNCECNNCRQGTCNLNPVPNTRTSEIPTENTEEYLKRYKASCQSACEANGENWLNSPGYDWCDKPEPTPEPEPTCPYTHTKSSCKAQYGASIDTDSRNCTKADGKTYYEYCKCPSSYRQTACSLGNAYIKNTCSDTRGDWYECGRLDRRLGEGGQPDGSCGFQPDCGTLGCAKSDQYGCCLACNAGSISILRDK